MSRDSYRALWADINACRLCRDDARIDEATRLKWDRRAFVPFPSKGPEPQGLPVRYLILAEEPSSAWTRGQSREAVLGRLKESKTLRNFNGSLGDFVFRWAARRWLVKKHEAFYMTDLGKSSVPGTEAGPTRARRYRNCFPFLRREVELYRKTLRAIIPVGDHAYMWALGFAESNWPPITKPVVHWGYRFPHKSRAAWDKSYRPDFDDVNDFIQETKPDSSRKLRPRDKKNVRLIRIYKESFTRLRKDPTANLS